MGTPTPILIVSLSLKEVSASFFFPHPANSPATVSYTHLIGAVSLKKANVYKAKMSEETTMETDIIKWFVDTYTGAQLDLSLIHI